MSSVTRWWCSDTPAGSCSGRFSAPCSCDCPLGAAVSSYQDVWKTQSLAPAPQLGRVAVIKLHPSASWGGCFSPSCSPLLSYVWTVVCFILTVISSCITFSEGVVHSVFLKPIHSSMCIIMGFNGCCFFFFLPFDRIRVALCFCSKA